MLKFSEKTGPGKTKEALGGSRQLESAERAAVQGHRPSLKL